MTLGPPQSGWSACKVGRRTAVWTAVFSFVVLALATDPSATPSESRIDSSTAARFLAQQDQPLTQYRAFRRMHARSDRLDQEAWLEVQTELDDTGFRYEIVSERGSDYTRNKVLKAILRREQELVAAGHAERATLSAENYQFTDTASREEGVLHILLKPKRKDVLLVDGRMVLNEDATELLRIEGRLAKNPSFWTSSVNVIRHYGRLDGVRVPVSTESIAKIRLVGTSRLEVQYDYESINGRPVSLAARDLQAALR